MYQTYNGWRLRWNGTSKTLTANGATSAITTAEPVAERMSPHPPGTAKAIVSRPDHASAMRLTCTDALI